MKMSFQDEQGRGVVCGKGRAGEPAGGGWYQCGGRLKAVLPLTQPATKVTFSNVPPIIAFKFLCRELSRQNLLYSEEGGCKSPLLKHVVSNHRQLYMILINCDKDL